MTARRGILSALLLAAALVATGCAGLATSGPVNEGLPPGESGEVPAFSFRPESPQPGATPEQIVEGFLRAGSGPAGNWSVAQEFLAPSFRKTWKPEAGVTIDTASTRFPTATADGQVAVDLTPVATVDATGAYEPSDAGPTTLSFALEQVDGEWRITQAPDGIVLDRDQFTSVFRSYPIMYFDPTWTYLVPDVRWFPATNVATRIAEALIDGLPSPWLAESVVTAFPEGTALAQRAVPVVARTAQVELTSEALAADTVSLDRMQTQLEASLATPEVSAVEMSVGQTPLTATVLSPRSTRVSSMPLVRNEDGFGYLGSEQLTAIEAVSEAIAELPVVAAQADPRQELVAVRLDDGTVGRVHNGGGFEQLDTRPALADPSVDPHGYVWSVPRTAPAAVMAFGLDAPGIRIADAWPDATELAAMSVSRDGTRLAAVVTSGGRTSIWIAGIVRDGEGAPVRLSQPFTLGWVTGAGVGLAWVDDSDVAVLTREPEAAVVVEQVVGGRQVITAAPPTAATIASVTSTSPVRLRTDDGGLLVKRGVNWQQTATGILLLATQQSSPR